MKKGLLSLNTSSKRKEEKNMFIKNLQIYSKEYRKIMRGKDLYLIEYINSKKCPEGLYDLSNIEGLPEFLISVYGFDREKGIDFQEKMKDFYGQYTCSNSWEKLLDDGQNVMIVKTGESLQYVREILTEEKIPIYYRRKKVNVEIPYGKVQEIEEIRNKPESSEEDLEIIDYDILSKEGKPNTQENRIAYFNASRRLSFYHSDVISRILKLYEKKHYSIETYKKQLRELFMPEAERIAIIQERERVARERQEQAEMKRLEELKKHEKQTKKLLLGKYLK